MTFKPTVIIVSEEAEAKQAITILKASRHPKAIIILPVNIPAVAILRQHKVSFTLLDKLIKPTPEINHLTSLPFHLSQYLVKHCEVKDGEVNLTQLFIDIVQFKLYLLLSQYFTLKVISKQLNPSALLISPQAFSPLITNIVSQQDHFSVKFFPTLRHKFSPISSIHQSLSLTIKYLKLLFTHPQNIIPIIIGSATLRSVKPSKFQKRILFFSNGLNLLSYASFIHELDQNPGIHLRLVTDKQSFLDRFYLSQSYLRLKPPSTKLTSRQSIIHHRLQLKLNRQLKCSPNLETLSFPIPIDKAVFKIIINQVLSQVADDSSPTIKKYLQVKQLIRQYKPELVITTHDPGPSALAFTLPAKSKHIPTAVLLHGSPSQEHYFLSDVQVIWGRQMKSWLIQQGIPSRQLLNGGNPIYFDYYRYFSNHLRRSHQPTIGIITSGHGHYEWHQTIFLDRLFAQLAKIKPQVKISIRTHPMQQIRHLPILAKHYHLDLEINTQTLLEEFIAQTDIVIAQNSTAALVPLIAHKPTILINLWHPLALEGLLFQSRAYYHLKSWSDLPRLIDRLIKLTPPPSYLTQRQDKFIQAYCGPIDAKIGQRIAQKLIAKL